MMRARTWQRSPDAAFCRGSLFLQRRRCEAFVEIQRKIRASRSTNCWQRYSDLCLSRRRSRVRVPSCPLLLDFPCKKITCGLHLWCFRLTRL